MEWFDWVRPNIRNLVAYSSARNEYNGMTGVYLDANENPFGSWNRYPDPQQMKLKQLLSPVKGVEVENIFLGNGSDEIIDLVMRVFCEPQKDRVLTLCPSYGMYETLSAVNNIELVKVSLDEYFQIDRVAMKPFLNDNSIKLIIVCSPNNPTGNALRCDDIVQILDSFKGIVLIDEAYIDFTNKDSFIKHIQKYPNLIVCQTFSKAWGLAGARVGAAYATASIVDLLNKVKPPYNISTNNQRAVISSLSNIDEFKANRDILLKERDWLSKQLNKVPVIKKVYPTDANFILVLVDDAESVYQFLLNKSIIIRNRNEQIPNALRITVGSPNENRLLIKVLNELK